MYAKKIIWALPLFCLTACGNGADRLSVAKSDSAAGNNDQQNYGVPQKQVAAGDPTQQTAIQRKMVRTADFKCKVQNVFESMTALERMVQQLNGIVQESHLNNEGYESRRNYYSQDSLIETRTYTTTGTLTLRIPCKYLDSVTNAIPRLSSFIESRTLRQEDVSLKYLKNEMKNQMADANDITDQAKQQSKKSSETIGVQEYTDRKNGEQISRKLENLALLEQVEYATLTVAFVQPERVYIETLADPGALTRVPFMHRLAAAIRNGGSAVVSLFVAVVSIWPLLIVVITAWMIWVRRRSKTRIALNMTTPA